MRSTQLRFAFLAWALIVMPALSARAGTRGADELFWVPTFEQALQMAAHTGRPIFLMHYTCVGEKSETFSGTSTVW
jgi:hypothetical protein